MIGGGKHLPSLRKLAKSIGVKDRVIFRGTLPTPGEVKQELDKADMFILPSRTEGLPRALIEAMARGLPCIGTNVGGIPELLAEEDLVCRDDFRALARKIREVISSNSRMLAMTERNLRKVKEFQAESLRIKRNEFYRKIRTATEEWLKAKSDMGRLNI
jgi:glycosyltransferase involved in cell wall biosynthesis